MSHEKEHSMRGVGFTEIHSKNYFCLSESESQPRRVKEADKLKVYEKQTKQNPGRLRFAGGS
jgi:hypothetical protein